MKQIIFFDIDYTLINTDVLRPYLSAVAAGDRVSLPYLQSVYPEVRNMLHRLEKDYRLGIFSEAPNRSDQLSKLLGSKLIHFFVPALIFVGRSKALLIRKVTAFLAGEAAVFVDDKPESLQIVSLALPAATTIRIRRGKYAAKKSEYRPDSEITNLKQLLQCLPVKLRRGTARN